MSDPRFLLDSNIVIYVVDGMVERLRQRLENQAPGSVVVSSITYAEVMRGIDPADPEREARAQLLFTVFPVAPFDRVGAECYRSVPFRRGRFDNLIAAHALALGLTLITNNERDFADIPGLKVENWTT